MLFKKAKKRLVILISISFVFILTVISSIIVLNDNIITIIPNSNWFGELIVNTIVYDLSGLSDYESFSVNVLSVNDPPSFISSPVINAFEDIEYSYQVLVTYHVKVSQIQFLDLLLLLDQSSTQQ